MIIALDPGKTTGIAVVHSHVDPPVARTFELDFFETAKLIDENLAAWSQDGWECEVVMERFIITGQTAKKTQAPWSLELIGVGRYLADKYGATFDLQSPSDAKNFCPDSRLKELGLYVKRSDHIRDALRHFVLYWARTRNALPPVVESVIDG